MKVNCLSCGHTIDLEDETYSDYDGAIKCYACGAIVEVKLVEGHLKSVRLPERPSRAAPAAKGKPTA